MRLAGDSASNIEKMTREFGLGRMDEIWGTSRVSPLRKVPNEILLLHTLHSSCRQAEAAVGQSIGPATRHPSSSLPLRVFQEHASASRGASQACNSG